MNSTTYINWEQLSLIVGEENEPVDEEMKELYVMFIDDAGSRLRSLNDTSREFVPSNVAKEAHKIRGAASSFGFDTVSGLLAIVETQIDELPKERVYSLLSDALRGFEQSIRDVHERHPRLAA
jgi:HPt (histidine-containing phosphotransfer) domain-containing protein